MSTSSLAESPRLRIRILGTFQILDADEPVSGIDTPRLQSLLAYLLLFRGDPQPRRQVAFQLWPDSTESRAFGNLRRELHMLRQHLPSADQCLEITSRTLQWRADAPFTLDVADFERALATAENREDADRALRDAVDLYRGALLPNCYDDWIGPQRERLERAYLKALARLVTHLEEAQSYAVAIDYAQRLLDHDPLDEGAYRSLMRLHALNNDRAAALRTYHTCSRVLERELGVLPDQATETLYLRLLNLSTDGNERQPKVERRPTQMRLIGRQREWLQLRDLWEHAERGHAHFVLLRGEAGIGKSMLAEEFARWVRNQGSGDVANARAYALQQNLAYRPVIEWLHTPPLQEALTQLEDVWLVELARLLPELLVERPALPRPQPMTDSWQRQRLFESLTRLVRAISKPLLLILDDLQWCDLETLEWLHYLLVSCQKSPLFLIATLRAGEVTQDHPVAVLLREAGNSDQLTEIRLARMSLVETTQLVEQVTGNTLDTDDVDHIFAESEGVPLFTVEMARAQLWTLTASDRQMMLDSPQASRQPSTLPPKIHLIIESRLGALSTSARKLAAVAAVIGRAFTFEILAAITARNDNDSELLEALDELWQRRIIRESGIKGYDFNHDKIREVAYAGVSPILRRLLHRDVARALEQVHTADLDAVAGRVALHYELSGLTENAVSWYQRAAGVTRNLHALTEAELHLRAAWRLISQLPDSDARAAQEIRILLDMHYVLLSLQGFTYQENGELMLRLRDLAVRIDDTHSLVVSLMHSMGSAFSSGRMETARRLSLEAVTVARQFGDATLLARALMANSSFSIRVGEFRAALAAIEDVATMFSAPPGATASKDDGAGLVRIEPNLSIVLWVMGWPDQAADLAHKAEENAHKRYGGPLDLTIVYYLASVVYRNLGELDLVAERAAQMISHGGEYGLLVSHLDGMVFKGWTLARQGDIDEGIEWTRRGVDAYRKTGHTMYQTHRLAMLAEMHLWAAQFDAASDVLKEAFAISTGAGEQFWDVELNRLQGDLLFANGAPDADAEQAYRQAISVARRQETKSLELRAVQGLCRLWQRQGNDAQAHALLSETLGWFTEGFDTADLRAAQSLLDELSVSSDRSSTRRMPF